MLRIQLSAPGEEQQHEKSQNTEAKSKSSTHIAGVVDEPGEVAVLGGVDHVVVVDPEQVGAADARRLILLLPQISD